MAASTANPTLDDGRDALSLTDEEDNGDYDSESQLPELAGTLSKWTNYIHGWQDRYIVLKGGTISYYKSEQEAAVGCRGAVSLSKAVISAHEFDDCRFDVGINDCLWYLRAASSEQRHKWISMMELHKAESGYASESGLRRHGSKLSLTSTASLSTISTSSFKRGRGLREKLAEMETFKDILSHQVDSLQNYFDACASAVVQRSVHDAVEPDDLNEDIVHDVGKKNGISNSVFHQALLEASHHDSHRDLLNILQQHGAHAIDFKGEAYTFKATTAGIIATLGHCIELMAQREEAWRKRLEREIEKRRKVEDNFKHLLKERPKAVVHGGPDFEEGPHSMLPEEEFFDAVDATLDKLDKEEEKKNKLRAEAEKTALSKVAQTSLDCAHPLYDEINKVVDEHIRHADMTASDVANTWTLIASEGEMKVYKRDIDEASAAVVQHPLKAVHTVKGITGHELCHYFWDPSVRMEWEVTLDTSTVLNWLSQDTHITYQVLKRVWPIAQRDSVFWSTIRHCPSDDDDGPDYWIVVNHSSDYTPAPPSAAKCVRILFNIAMICQTVVQPPPPSGQPITRDHLTCRIQYSANVNPGGWVPASVIQVISKREAPKFLKNFTAYVQEKTKDKEIMF